MNRMSPLIDEWMSGLTLILLNTTILTFAKGVDPDQIASEVI